MATADPSADSELDYLCLGHLNICSLRNKHERKEGLDIQTILKKYKIHVLALTETKLDDSVQNSKLHIKNFSFYRKDRKGRKGGGVGFYIQNQREMRVIQRYDLDQKDLEMIWVEIFLPHKRPLLVGCCYRADDSKIDYLIKICRKIEMVSNEGKDIFLLGDFNIDWLKESPDKTRIDFVSSVCGLTQIINEPTRVDEKRCTSTCIDHIYTNISDISDISIHSEPVLAEVKSLSDHKLITATVEKRVLRHSNTKTDPLSKHFQSLSFRSKVSQSEVYHALKFRRAEEEEVKRLLPLAPFNPANNLNLFIDRGEFPSETSENCIYHWILEKILLQQMEEYFNKYKLFTQYETLGNITNQWITDLINNKEAGVVFMNFNPSSDAISCELLLHKLKSYSFSHLAISMMRSFLFNTNSSSCCWTDAHCELTRGSCMTHFLFSVYTNDLKVALKIAHVVVSGSQLMIYHSADNYEDLKKVLREESENVHVWLRENGMVLKTFTSARIKSKTQVEQIKTHLSSTISVNVEDFNWIKVLRVLLHDAPHLVWTS